MSDLVISGGGTTAVAVDDLFADVHRLAAADAVLQGWIDRFAVLRERFSALVDEASASGGLPWPATEIWQVGGELDAIAARISEVRRDLQQAAERYGETERFISALWDLGGAIGASTLGFLAPQVMTGSLLAMLALAPAVGLGLGLAHAVGAEPEAEIVAGLREWAAENRGILNDPVFVRFVRTVADHADEFVLGALHVPHALALGSRVDAPESASIILGATGLLAALGSGSSRTLVDGPVRVVRVMPDATGPARDPAIAPPPSNAAVRPPDGFEDLANRIPPSDGEAQITLERHVVDGESRWIAYLGGTVDFTLVAGAQTHDMTSNVHGIADDSALDALRPFGADSGGAERAVRLALAEAGAAPGDPILAVGHSAGGVIAAGLAGLDDLNVVEGVNFGGPIASAPIPPEVPFTSVEHDDDLVPATGGNGHAQNVLVVARRVYENGYDGDEVLPAHQLVSYGATAAMLDDSDDPSVIAAKERIRRFTAGTVGEQTRWRAERVPEEEP